MATPQETAHDRFYQPPTWEIRVHLTMDGCIKFVQVYHLGIISHEKRTVADGRTGLDYAVRWARTVTGNDALTAAHLSLVTTPDPKVQAALLCGLVQAVQAHAQAHYEEGWDIIVEAYEDTEIIEAIGDATTPEQAIARMAEIVEVRNDTRQEYAAFAEEYYV